MGTNTDKNCYVIKSNALNEARYQLPLIEQKIIIMMVSRVRRCGQGFPSGRLYAREFADACGVSQDHMYSQIKEATHNLLSRVLVIPERDGDLQIGWISSAKYYRGFGYVDINFDERLRPYLLGLSERFLKYNRVYPVRMRSGFSIRVYELLKQYETAGKRTFTLQDFRSIIGANTKAMENAGELRRRAIVPAVKEINSGSDLRVTWRMVKRRRKYVSVTFSIRGQRPPSALKPSAPKVAPVPDPQIEKYKRANALLEDMAINDPDSYHLLEEQGRTFMAGRENKPGYENGVRLYMRDNVEYFNAQQTGGAQ